MHGYKIWPIQQASLDLQSENLRPVSALCQMTSWGHADMYIDYEFITQAQQNKTQHHHAHISLA